MGSQKACDVSILAFSEPGELSLLQEMLMQLGYRVEVSPLISGFPVRLRTPTDIAVLFLTHRNFPKDKLLTRLNQEQDTTWLALLSRNEPEWDPTVLRHCHEFTSWPCSEQELRLRLEKLTIHRKVGNWKDEKGDNSRFLGMNLVGREPVFLDKLSFIQRVGQWDAPVLIQGETGTGKELFARALHYVGARRDYAFVPVNCGAIPDTLLENELFGHERGAFTDAHDRQAGLVSQAQNGTLFLDEVDALSQKAQIALLRFLQDQIYQPLGSTESSWANVRVIAASNSDIAEQVAKREFRRDLFYRLNVLSLPLPSLRDRRNDIPLLADHFLRQISSRYSVPPKTIHPQVLQWMCQYDWPGNVRELENFLHRSMIVTEGSVIDQILGDCKEAGNKPSGEIHSRKTSVCQFSQAKATAVADFEKGYLIDLMKEFQGNVSRAAKQAGKERRAFGKLLKKNGIHKEDFLSETKAC